MANYKARPLNELHSNMNYMYYHLWNKIITGKYVRYDWNLHDFKKCPIYFGYALKDKVIDFHNQKWLDILNKADKDGLNCKV